MKAKDPEAPSQVYTGEGFDNKSFYGNKLSGVFILNMSKLK
jgi:hypothetical protein